MASLISSCVGLLKSLRYSVSLSCILTCLKFCSKRSKAFWLSPLLCSSLALLSSFFTSLACFSLSLVCVRRSIVMLRASSVIPCAFSPSILKTNALKRSLSIGSLIAEPVSMSLSKKLSTSFCVIPCLSSFSLNSISNTESQNS